MNKESCQEKRKNHGYTVKTLAAAYFPDHSTRSASQSFRRMLHKTPMLMDKLRAAGFQHKQRILTPLLRDIIFEGLGEP